MANEHLITRYITINGVTRSVADWARETGIDYATLLYRVNRGIPEDQLFEKPKAVCREARPDIVGSAGCAYTEEELYLLYCKFAGEKDALRILADFMGVPSTSLARPTYEKFKAKRKAERP